MCGISAIIGKNVVKELFKSIKQLENRGYDSAGLSIIGNKENAKIVTLKYVSTLTENSIQKLERESTKLPDSNIGIIHTRWATHGKKSCVNSHPHLSNNSKFSLVHNGIIENYYELKEELIKNGYLFHSETDTEVIVNLIDYLYSQGGVSIDEAIKKLNFLLKGSWAIVFLCTDFPNTLFCTKYENPLLISKNQTHIVVTSEEAGLYGAFDEYIILEDYEYIQISMNVGFSFDCKKTKKINKQNFEVLPDKFPYWTLKEIYEQPESLLKTLIIDGRLKNGWVFLEGFDNNRERLLNLEHLLIVGCGTSYNAGVLSTHFFKKFSSFVTIQNIDASEFTLKDIPTKGSVGMIIISQSGETKDAYACIKMVKDSNVVTIGIVNVVNSLIAREVDLGCYLNIGREVGVASTKSFTSQSFMLSLVSLWFYCNQKDKKIPLEICKDILNLSKDVKKCIILHDEVKKYIPFFSDVTSCFILGTGSTYSIAREGSLKIKEISYIHAEDYPLGSLKHGPFALLTNKTLVIILFIGEKNINKIMNCYNEVKSRDCKIMIISDQVNIHSINNFLQIPKNKTYGDLLCTIPLQLLAYELSLSRNINPDIPRNLAKVVTV